MQVIQKFKNGDYNVLVATSIGEEGLDIGDIDLIICYDTSSSPVRMVFALPALSLTVVTKNGPHRS